MSYILHKKFRTSQGYSLLLAILIINIVLAMSLGIFSITMKALQLSSFTKDSQKAFGVADRALECVLYWDNAYDWNGMTPAKTIFSTSTAYTPPTNLSSATCDGQQLSNAALPPTGTGWAVTNTVATGTTKLTLTYTKESTCAEIDVVKGLTTTRISVSGYNTCASANPRKVQRTIQVDTQ